MFMAPSARWSAEPPGTSAGGPPPASISPWLVTHGIGDPLRAEVEDFIRAVYARRFGATVQTFAPVLVSLRGPGGLLAAAGYRPAALEPLFLEHYLGRPVEAALGGHTQAPALRRHVVEVGHLSAGRAGEGRRLLLLLGPYLAQQGYQWIGSTVTEELRHMLARLGLTPLALGGADPRALGEQAAPWGSYYEHNPVVVGVHLPQALRQVARRMARGGKAA